MNGLYPLVKVNGLDLLVKVNDLDPIVKMNGQVPLLEINELDPLVRLMDWILWLKGNGHNHLVKVNGLVPVIKLNGLDPPLKPTESSEDILQYYTKRSPNSFANSSIVASTKPALMNGKALEVSVYQQHRIIAAVAVSCA
ncbi:hypothetical protein CDAR_41361 [Caerostris darwini]|uniref:Uncharacterized protein n=1 Tax=Caerostris darwini TaxID=1538125 RepID=A0AAV4SKR5_9ARAC|nr:hypothetical protein CDAR_41361 [Caerostris darwini]